MKPFLTRTRIFFKQGLLPVVYILMLLVMFILPFYSVNEYSILKNTTSYLGAQSAPHAWVMNVVFALLGIAAIVDGWCVFGLAIGFSGDLAYRFTPRNIGGRWRAIITGLVLGIMTFILTLVAVTNFYIEQQSGPGSFLGIAYYGAPFMLASSGFGGYTTYAISRSV